MPTPQDIHDVLMRMSNDWKAVAIVWHLVIAAGIVAFLVGWRPSRRLLGAILPLPLFSASALAWMAGNVFNGSIPLILGALLVLIALRLDPGPVRLGRPWTVAFGGVMLVFGLIYPHFLNDGLIVSVYAAPTGIVPCPTLAAVLGMAMVVNGLGSPLWSLLLAAGALFYGVFGALVLGVAIDAILCIGAIGLILLGAANRRNTRTSTVG